jgi:hypothetical protein
VSEEHGGASAATIPYSAEEQAAMHADDYHAAKSVFLLMVGVFSAGLVLYLIVALTL